MSTAKFNLVRNAKKKAEFELSSEQSAAVAHRGSPLVVLRGPKLRKTLTLDASRPASYPQLTSERIHIVKRLAIPTLLLFLTALTPLQHANAAIKEGSKCSPAGASFKQSGANFICTKVSGKTIWKKKLSAPSKKETSGIQSKSFSLDNATFSDEYGLATASARVTNISSRSKSGVMTITIFKSDGNSIFMTLMGSAQDVKPGETVTVQFVGSGALPTGTFKYNFQVDAEF